MIPQDPDHVAKATMDIMSLFVVAGTLIDALPSIAAGVSVLWGCIRIYETETVQRWLGGK